MGDLKDNHWDNIDVDNLSEISVEDKHGSIWSFPDDIGILVKNIISQASFLNKPSNEPLRCTCLCARTCYVCQSLGMIHEYSRQALDRIFEEKELKFHG